MKRTIINRVAFAAFFSVSMALLNACGDEITETRGVDTVASLDKLSECSADNAGEMVYVADSVVAIKALMICPLVLKIASHVGSRRLLLWLVLSGEALGCAMFSSTYLASH